MNYLSVCSGIEAATCAWHDLGWTPEAFSEIEKFPSEVLAHHYPEVPNLGDMTKFKEWNIGSIDLLVGGTPCQSFSVAGLRKGLDDPRGNLALVYLAIADKFKPRWIVWENVPGVLSSNRGRDFGAFLGGLGELGYGFSYRVLDAQYFGVAQRRRRVFVVGHSGGCWKRPAQVLLERESMCGNPAPSREAGEGTARAVAPCLEASDGNKWGCNQWVDAGKPVIENTTVRRLTPTECERLQGFPDNYTRIAYRNKGAEDCPDGPRYKALGNSMAVPVMKWIGERIQKFEELNEST